AQRRCHWHAGERWHAARLVQYFATRKIRSEHRAPGDYLRSYRRCRRNAYRRPPARVSGGTGLWHLAELNCAPAARDARAGGATRALQRGVVVRDGTRRRAAARDNVAVAGLAATKAIPTDRARYCGRVAMIEAHGDLPLGLEDQAARRSP